MKFLVLSDLHLEFGSFAPPSNIEFDAVIEVEAKGEKKLAII